MRPCIHLRPGVKDECALGISPMDCNMCGMREVQHWRTSQQPTANSPNARVINSPDSEVAVKTSGTAEQKLLQSAAVKGGCGCKKGN